MAVLVVNNLFFILGILFLTISVIGQSKLLFLEINPGCFGRFLALILGGLSLYLALPQGTVAIPNLDFLRTFVQNMIPEFTNMVKQIQLFD
ncbi:hypothetical protein NIES4101_29920 [Calothrix sp. NIES-4101]|nr:hypothetical protein NIES4101_29920 [Calothrix sp. NIES-4101]